MIGSPELKCLAEDDLLAPVEARVSVRFGGKTERTAGQIRIELGAVWARKGEPIAAGLGAEALVHAVYHPRPRFVRTARTTVSTWLVCGKSSKVSMCVRSNPARTRTLRSRPSVGGSQAT